MTNVKVKVLSAGLMVGSILVVGKLESNTEKVSMSVLKAREDLVSGRMERKSNGLDQKTIETTLFQRYTHNPLII